jgi:hypothetical protein
MTVHEQMDYLYGFDHLNGGPATLFFLPTPRSRKWRRGFYVQNYSEVAYNNAMALLNQENWASFKFEKGMLS